MHWTTLLFLSHMCLVFKTLKPTRKLFWDPSNKESEVKKYNIMSSALSVVMTPNFSITLISKRGVWADPKSFFKAFRLV